MRMFESIIANVIFQKLLGRPDISQAYKMVPKTDSWYDTIQKVHDSLAEIQTLPHEEWQVHSNDGLTLRGVYYPGGADSNVTVVCIHGYTSHAEREWAFPGLFYHSLGYNVLIPYQRAHGKSQGKYISFGPMEAKDMAVWIEKINRTHPDGKVIVHGLSMGGGIALLTLEKELPGVACVIADAPSDGVCRFFENVIREQGLPHPQKLLAACIKKYKRTFGIDPQTVSVGAAVANAKYPLLLAAGSNEHYEGFFEELKAQNPQPTEVVILPGCNHGNGMYKQTELFQSAIREFVQKAIET